MAATRRSKSAVSMNPTQYCLTWMMPGIDGLATFQRLQADKSTRNIPVILFTAKGRTGERQPWQDTAIRGFIAKPYNPGRAGQCDSRVGIGVVTLSDWSSTRCTGFGTLRCTRRGSWAPTPSAPVLPTDG